MKRKVDKKNTDYSMAHILYQKLGNDWYAFTEVDGDCFMTKVDEAAMPSDTIEQQQSADQRKRNKAA